MRSRSRTRSGRPFGADTILRRLLRENLTLHPSIQERVGQFQAARFQQPVIGVQVRYMDQKSGLAELRRKVEWLLDRTPGARRLARVSPRSPSGR